jgi:hypothetical protein
LSDADLKYRAVGPELRNAPCPWCARTMREYADAAEPTTSLVEHEPPWCDGYTDFIEQHGIGKVHNPKDETNPS